MTSRTYNCAVINNARAFAKLYVSHEQFNAFNFDAECLVQESALALEVRLAERAYSDALRDIEASLLLGQGRCVIRAYGGGGDAL